MGVALTTATSTSSTLINASITKLKLDVTITTTSTSNIAKYIYKLYMIADGGVWTQGTSKTCSWRIKCDDLGLDSSGAFNATALNNQSSYVIKEGQCYQPASLISKNSTTVTVYAFFPSFNSGGNCYTVGTTTAASVTNGTGGWPVAWNLMSVSGSGNYKLYTINYLDNLDEEGISGMPSTQYKLHGDTKILHSSTPTRPNYNFKIWQVSGGTTTYKLGASYTANANLTLNPVWSANEITLSYSSGSGNWVSSPPAAVTQNAGTSFTLTNVQPVKPGFDFAGWTDGTANYNSGQSYVFQKTIELQPIFNMKNSTKSLFGSQVAISDGTDFYGYNTYIRINDTWKAVTPMIYCGEEIGWVPCKYQENN